MTREEARACFDAAVDDELSADERARFEAALAREPELRAEYERHRATIEAARRLFEDPGAVDLLDGVQRKLRARSGGRFYRDRFAGRRGLRGGVGLLVGISGVVVLLVLAWLAYVRGLLGS